LILGRFLLYLATVKYLIVVLVALIVLWLFAGGLVLEVSNKIAYGASQVFLWPKWWFLGLLQPALSHQQQARLKLELEDLKAEIFKLRQLVDYRGDPKLLIAKIHSRRPFNDKDLLSINVGRAAGVKEKMAVTVASNLFLGIVEQVFDNYSLVKTIFTSGWQIPVRFGKRGLEALLVGGPDLRVTLIVRDQPVATGETIFLASKEFPYGLKVGEVEEIKEDPASGVFKEATVRIPYNFNDLTEVWLHK